MKQDKQLKQILLNSAEKASVDFTDTIMKKVNALSVIQLYYQPLVSPKWQRLFLFAFGALIVAILALCLIIGLTPIHVVSWIQSLNLPVLSYNRLLVFIVTFWIVFCVNALLEKKFLSGWGAFL